MKKIKGIRVLTKAELLKLNAGTTTGSGECDEYFAAMPEPGRYCKASTY